jgi:ADP-ribosyl-[dinitrogen reductase] hydrolase
LKSYQQLKGTGYVIDSLEAALWCFYHTDNYADCVLAAANLGNDADTTAAVAGQLAGACYGYAAIRPAWREALHREAEICQLADQLFALDQQQSLSLNAPHPEFTP